jgi:hypothetical protein
MLRGRAKTIKSELFCGMRKFEDVKKVKRRNKPSSLGVCSEPNAPTVLEVCREGAEGILSQLDLRSENMSLLTIHLDSR